MQRIDVAYMAAYGVLVAAGAWCMAAPLPHVPAVMPRQGGYHCEVRGEVALMRRAAVDRWMVRVRQADGLVAQAFVARALLPGDEVTLRGTCVAAPGFFVPGSATPAQRAVRGGYDFGLNGGVVTQHLPGAHWHWRRGMAKLGEAVYETIVSHVDQPDARGLLLGLVLGSTSELGEDDQTIWRDLGTVHALSVSGLHLTVVALCAYFLWSRLAIVAVASPARGLVVAYALTGGVVLLYAGVTGFQIATVRALIMTSGVLVATATGRSIAGWRLLIMSLACMILWSPGWMADPSFQLSATATAALIAAAPWFVNQNPVPHPSSRLRRALGWLAGALLVSGWVALVTAPIVAYHFHQVAPASPLANIAVTSLCEFVALPLALLGVCAAPFSDALANACLCVAQWSAQGSLMMARWLGGWLPAIECAPPDAWAMTWYFVGCATAWLALHTKRVRWWSMAALALLLAGAGARRNASPGAADALRIVFIDVGQGDAALLEFPGGARWLIDAGAETAAGAATYDPVLRYLRARRITALDRVVISHRHADHFGALCHFAGRIHVAALWRADTEAVAGPPAAGDAQAFARCEQALAERGTVIAAPTLGPYRDGGLGGATINVLGPTWFDAATAPQPRIHATADSLRGENDNSIVLLITFGGRRIVFLGDAEHEEEDSLVSQLGPVDLVKVGHHGSRTSSSQALVAALRPVVAVVSVGRRNRFGLPNRDALVRWEHIGARVLRTDEQGTLTVTIADSGAWQWFTYLRGVVDLR